MLDPLSQSNVGANPASGQSTPIVGASVRSQAPARTGFSSGRLRSGRLRSAELRSHGRRVGSGSAKAALPDNDFEAEGLAAEDFEGEYLGENGLGAEGPQPEGSVTENVRSKKHDQSSVDKSSVNKVLASQSDDVSASGVLASEPAMNVSLKRKVAQVPSQKKDAKAKRRLLSQNGFLKRLDALYWKRLIRYFYIRFLRIRSSPHAIARGMAAGMFAGAFPLVGLQSLIGIAIAACIRGNKVLAAASTWISNPITFVPLFALNFYVGRWLLHLPSTTTLPPSPAGLGEWMTVGMDVAAAMMVGSLVMGLVFGVVGYYAGLLIAQRVRRAKVARRVAKRRRR